MNLGTDTSICEGVELDIMANCSNYNSLFWYTNGDGYFSDNSVISSIYYPGNSDYTNGSVNLNVEIIGLSPCPELFANMIVNFISKPNADFTINPLIPVVNENVHFDFSGSGASIFDWYISGNQSPFLNNQNATYTFTSAGEFEVWLIAANSSGCIDSVAKYVLVEDKNNIFVPNVFTPNDDNVNDMFYVMHNGTVINFRIEIIDRLGNILFESKNSHFKWDGKYKGILCPTGVYVYHIVLENFSGNKFDKRGTLLLIN